MGLEESKMTYGEKDFLGCFILVLVLHMLSP
uniref:Uncharacterized protein n=1 Tax=Lepeophtheirus salmonis TaxID=72036 RepID=A0A0K2VE45_LEPSM